jgi:alpha-glucosidase (family GH31 glycosyl hydrolase)
MSNRIVIGNRRFTCLATGLVRMEFSPNGVFEDRRSMVAYAAQRPVPFKAVKRRDGSVEISTGRLTIVSRENDKAFFPDNLEVRWKHTGLLHFWRPGDRDHQNLGGTVRALDMFNRHAELSGVHPADMESPDAKSMAWMAWDIYEVDPFYYQQAGREDALLETRGNIHHTVRYGRDKVLTRLANRTLDTYKYGPGLLSRSGHFFLNDSTSAVLDANDFPVERNTPGTQDWYFFGYGDDYKGALADWILLGGKAALPGKNTFGLIFSRWPAYDEAEAKRIIARFKEEGTPLSALVLDMEWHQAGWCNWDWESKMYADPKAFFKWCHANGIEVTINVHPLHIESTDSHFKPYLKAAGTAKRVAPFESNGKQLKKVEVNICNQREAEAFMRICHDEIAGMGLDYWWVDGCRGTLNGTCDQLVTNKLYFENVQTKKRRGMLLSRYGGLGSHRYGVFFTGDTASEWEVFGRLCEFNIRAGHLGLGYLSHDTGGFVHPSSPLVDPIRYIRWLQFGVFNPVLRFHSAPGSGSRQPWDYGGANQKIAAKWLRLRNSLLPYIYSAARQHHETGLPLVRGLYLERPDDERSYRFDEFLFGDALLVAPVMTMNERRDVFLPAGEWFEYLSGKPVHGGQTFGVTSALADMPVYIKAGSIVVRQTETVAPAAAHVSELLLDVAPGADGSAVLYEDDGKSRGYEKDGFCKTRFELSDDGKVITLRGRKPQGRPLGPERTIIVDLMLARKPRRVLLDGKALPSKACEEMKNTGRWRITLPARRSGASFTLVVAR